MEISLEKYPVFRDRINKNPDGGIIPNLWCEEGSYSLGNLNPLLSQLSKAKITITKSKIRMYDFKNLFSILSSSFINKT